MPARRGAPPGNKNALKHGLYSRAMSGLRVRDLEAVGAAGIQEEIAMLRAAMGQLFEMFFRLVEEDDPAVLPEICQTLGALGLAATRVSTLMRAQSKLSGQNDDTFQQLWTDLRELHKEWNLL